MRQQGAASEGLREEGWAIIRRGICPHPALGGPLRADWGLMGPPMDFWPGRSGDSSRASGSRDAADSFSFLSRRSFSLRSLRSRSLSSLERLESLRSRESPRLPLLSPLWIGVGCIDREREVSAADGRGVKGG